MDSLINNLKEQIKAKQYQIEIIERSQNVDLVELQRLKAEVNGLIDQLNILDRPENRQQAAENRKSIMNFLQEEHKRQDEEDRNVAEGLKKLKEEVGAKEHLFQKKDDSVAIPTPIVNEEYHSTLELAKLVRDKINIIYIQSLFHPNLENTLTEYIVVNNTKFNKNILESHREELAELLKILAGYDLTHLGLFKDGRPWANNIHDIDHLQTMAIALKLIPDLHRPKIIEIEDQIEENIPKHR